MSRAISHGTAFRFLQNAGLTNSQSMDYGSYATAKVVEQKNFYCKSEQCCEYTYHSQKFSKRANTMVETQERKIRGKVFKFSSSHHHDTCPDCSGYLFTK